MEKLYMEKYRPNPVGGIKGRPIKERVLAVGWDLGTTALRDGAWTSHL